MRRFIMIAGLLSLAPFAFAKPVPRTEPPRPASGSCVIMETSAGKIVIELFVDKAPITTANFLKYVDDRFYDGTIFHRVIAEFMIQGGGLVPGVQEKPNPRAPIKNEAFNGLSNERGTLAAARTSDPDSATSQFYINVKDNKFLDRANSPDKIGYAVFGKVVEGMDVIDRIRMTKTTAKNGHSDVPEQDVIILSVRRAAR
jgi:cyclophilin family peptidyl-prolyl cis-trans isomerase